MSLFIDLSAALQSSLPFSLAWKRIRCLQNNHVKNTSSPIETVHFSKHPQNDNTWTFKSSIYECSNCGLYFTNEGFGYRND